MVFNNSIAFMIIALVVAAIAIYALYAIILYQGNGKNGDDLQLSTKNILEQVKILYNTNEFALVELLATKYLERVPGHIDVRAYLAKAYYEDLKYNLAVKQCLEILSKRPNDLEIRELLGNCYIRKKLPGKALKEFEFIFDRKKDDKKVIRNLAELYKETDQIFMSISAYGVLADLMTSEQEIADIQLIIAELNEEVHDYPAAFEAYKSRLTIMPKDVETNKKLAELYIKINNYPVAIETLQYMLTFVNDPKTLLWIHEVLVDMYVETEDYRRAIEYSEKMLDMQGSDKFKVRDNIAQFNLKLNNYQDGILILEDLALMSQNGFDVTLELAQAYIQNKEYTKARDRYLVLLDKATPKEAKTVNALMSELYIVWAIDSANEGKYGESFDLLRDAIQYNPLNPEIFYNLGKNHFAQKNFAGAVEGANKALEYDKENANQAKYLLLLSEAHHELGNFFEEKKALTDLLKVDPKNPDGLYRLGLMYTAQHDIKNAEDAFKQAILYKPEHIQAKYNLALLYENNNRERARELYMEVLAINPAFEEARNALNDLSSSDYY